MDNSNIKEIKAARNRIMGLIKVYARKQYDARPLIPEYERLSKLMTELGRRPAVSDDIFSQEYWSNPAHWARAAQNKNPIVKAENGEVFWAKQTPQVVAQTQEPTRQIQPTDNSGYYKINISWTEACDNPAERHIVGQITKYFESMGLEEYDTDFNEIGNVVERTLTYKFKGTDGGFEVLKKSAIVLLEMLNNTDFKIEIYGKKIQF